MINNRSTKSLTAEAYRALRTSIQYSSVDKELRVLSITSSIPGEGKSTVAANLAFSMSEMEKKTILIDADLRKPTIHRKLKLSNLKGLTEGIVYKLELDEFIQKPYENFHVMTSGKIPPNPAEIVGSEAMSHLIEQLKEIYDYIIIDCPPVLSVTDPQLIATKVDGTILVVREGKAKSKIVLTAYEALQKVHANVIGTVLNDSKQQTKGYSKYYYQYEEDMELTKFNSLKNKLFNK